MEEGDGWTLDLHFLKSQILTLHPDVGDVAVVITDLHSETTQHSKQFEAVDAFIFGSFTH